MQELFEKKCACSWNNPEVDGPAARFIKNDGGRIHHRINATDSITVLLHAI